MQEVVDSLRERGDAGDATPIEVTIAADTLCMPCPHRRGEDCETSEKIKALDDAHAKSLGLKAGDIITWGEAKRRIAERISVEKHHEICAPCSWRSLGVCESALRKLKS